MRKLQGDSGIPSDSVRVELCCFERKISNSVIDFIAKGGAKINDLFPKARRDSQNWMP